MAAIPPLITVSASATTTVPATLADLTFNVQYDHYEASTAQIAVSQASNVVLQVLRQYPELSRLRTDDFSLQQRHDDDGKPVGYRAAIQLSVRTPLEHAGEVIALTTQQPNLTAQVLITDFSRTASEEVQQQAYEQALAAATTAAHRKATISTSALGLVIGSVRSIEIGETGPRYQSESMGLRTMASAVGAAPQVIPEIAGGNLDIRASVNLQLLLASGDLKNSSFR